MFPETLTSVKLAQSRNAVLDRDETDAGMLTLVNPLQSRNASNSIVVIESGMVILVNSSQLENAKAPIDVIGISRTSVEEIETFSITFGMITSEL